MGILKFELIVNIFKGGGIILNEYSVNKPPLYDYLANFRLFVYVGIARLYRNVRMEFLIVFLYNGESQLLYLHLWGQYPYMKKFIISESSITYSHHQNPISF